MNLTELVQRFARLVAFVVLGFSGYYVILYLLRWEWNRALLAGIFFLAAEIFLVADLAFVRFNRVSRQIELARETEEIRALAAQLRRSRPPMRGPFAWLSPQQDRTYVFVPILLAAGILLSALAYIVERLSRVTATPVAEHELARGLASMSLPRTGLAPTGQLQRARWDKPSRPAERNRRSTWVIAAIVVIITALIVVLRVVLITRPESADPNAALVVNLAVERNDLDQTEGTIALSLWALCQTRIPEAASLKSLEQSDPDYPGHFRMIVSPAPARFDTREFTGCLEDAVIDRALADVTSVESVPNGETASLA